MIDHTNLKPFASKKSIKQLCQEAKNNSFAAVCVNSCNVSLCKEELKGENVDIAAVVGFPLGATTSETKAFEAKQATELGATEIDMVMNVAALRENNLHFVKKDIEKVVKASQGMIVKVILETGYLTDQQIIRACKLVKEAEAHYVKTSTGFGPMGAFFDHVQLMRKTVGENFGVKAAGGIRDAKTAVRMINAGADRLGASAGISIIESLQKVLEEGKWFSEEEDKPETIYSWGAADPKKQPRDTYEFYIQKKEEYYKAR